jgi:hypothetical protein
VKTNRKRELVEQRNQADHFNPAPVETMTDLAEEQQTEPKNLIEQPKMAVNGVMTKPRLNAPESLQDAYSNTRRHNKRNHKPSTARTSRKNSANTISLMLTLKIKYQLITQLLMVGEPLSRFIKIKKLSPNIWLLGLFYFGIGDNGSNSSFKINKQRLFTN